MRVNVNATLLLLALFLLSSPSTGTTFTCIRFKGCVSEQGLRAYCHQPAVSSLSVTIILQSPDTFFDVYGFFSISQRFYLYRNGTFAAESLPPRNVWCYVGIDVLGNELDFELQNMSSVQDMDADFGPLNPFVDNSNQSSIFVPVDESFNTDAALGALESAGGEESSWFPVQDQVMASITTTSHLVCEASSASEVSISDIEQAANAIKGRAHLTSVLSSRLVNQFLSAGQTEFFFKCENFQKTGSFKFRGAYNAVSALQLGAKKGSAIVTHSSGNHAQAIAAAAALHNVPAHVVMPNNAAQVKVQAVKDYGGQITFCKPTSNDRVKTAEQVRKDLKGVLVHPFENPNVVAGQGTVGLELMHQTRNLDAIIVPIGGGGLISGITIAVKSIDPNIVVIGAEPELANGAYQSFQRKERVLVTGASETVADGLKTGIGSLGWQVVSRLVDRIITVSEEEILQSTKMIWQFMKIVIEPSSGVGVAAAHSKDFRNLGYKRVGVILCGGNVSLERLPWQE